MNLHLAILRCAAMLVPGSRRADWLDEWRSELWYVHRRRGRAVPFCLGAFRDAQWMRRNSADSFTRGLTGLQSPLQCLLVLAGLAGIAALIAVRVPPTRDILLAFPYIDTQNLVMVSATRPYAAPRPSVSIAQYRTLSANMRRQFSEVAFYKPVRAQVRFSPRKAGELSIAVATQNLFALLQVPAPLRPGSLILSEAAWHRYFGRAPLSAGHTVEISGRRVEVAGVLPGRLWRLPGKADAWLLEDDRGMSEHPQHEKGFVIARVWAPARSPQWNWRWRISTWNGQGDSDTFECVSLINRELPLAAVLMFAVALLLLPVTTSLTFGEYPAVIDRAARNARIRRWLFLGAKLVLLLPAVAVGVLDFAPISVMPLLMLACMIAALRWALRDQRERCPVCLRRLTGPVRVGCPSHIFLAWYGTELACPKGHGLMHVPEIPTSSYGTQRWLNLDPSWRSLFS